MNPPDPPMLDKTCPHCGSGFQVTQRKWRQSYCSLTCSRNAMKKRSKRGAKLSAIRKELKEDTLDQYGWWFTED